MLRRLAHTRLASFVSQWRYGLIVDEFDGLVGSALTSNRPSVHDITTEAERFLVLSDAVGVVSLIGQKG